MLTILALCTFAGCNGGSGKEEETPCPLEDGIYYAKFTTDSTMFHVNEVFDDICVLTVENGKMTIHVPLASKGILHLFMGTAEDAQKSGAVLLDPMEEKVLYPDGLYETVYAYDIPVPYLDEEFDCAIIGTKDVWYDHKVMVTDVTEYKEELKDGEYLIDVTLTGGSGKATITSPAKLFVENGVYTAQIEWSSPNYDLMIVDDVQFLPANTSGNSLFIIPVQLDTEMAVQAETVAMSEPHLIDYTLYFDSSTIK